MKTVTFPGRKTVRIPAPPAVRCEVVETYAEPACDDLGGEFFDVACRAAAEFTVKGETDGRYAPAERFTFRACAGHAPAERAAGARVYRFRTAA